MEESRKRQRTDFACDYPNCNKVFSRKDHLKRHQLNHNTDAKEHTCEECGMTFKRADVMKAHMKRHASQKEKEKKVLDSIESKLDAGSWVTSNDLMININDKIFFDENEKMNLMDFEDLADFLNRPHLNFEYSLNSTLDDLLESGLANIPTFDANYTLITQEIIREIIEIIPKLAEQPDYPQCLEICLNCYWDIFHVQYPILHKPSFNTISTPILLLLAMVMMGASLSECIESGLLQSSSSFANIIGERLRWLIFQHRSPGASEPWELQSLMILEVFEKHCSTRNLHERSSVHQSAKIEMMKRSTVLGGDPYATKSKSLTDLEGQSKDLLDRWIHAESMKRCALMAFCFDLNSDVTSSHQSTLYANKLKLGLPCDDVIWEADMETLKTMELPKNPNMVLTELKKLLKGEVINTSSFGNRVMLCSLLSLMIQFEQKDEITAMISDSYPSESSTLKNFWRDKISYALDVWKFNVNEGHCCDINNLLVQLNVRRSTPITKYLDLNDTKCKYPTYHMAQIRLRIVNHDMLIFTGVPRRMNVEADLRDYRNVEQRLNLWANSLDGRISVIHAYLCLIECLLNVEEKKIDYHPEKDPLPERPHIVNNALLILWSYNFLKGGSESKVYFKKIGGNDEYSFKESGYDYLTRIKNEIYQEINMTNPMEYHQSIKKCAVKLQEIKNLNHIGGLINQVSKLYNKCSWELGREYSRLLVHCKERVLGKDQVFCLNMYEKGS